MKRFLLFLLLAWSAYGQAPLQRNSITTNVLGTNFVYDPSVRMLTIAGSGGTAGIYQITSNGITLVSISADVNSVLPTLALSSATGNTVTKFDSGQNLVGIPNGASGTFLGISNGIPAYVNAPAQVWTNYTASDVEGGTFQVLDSTLSPSPATFAINYLTNLFGEFTPVIFLGTTSQSVTQVAAANAAIVGIGVDVFLGASITNSTSVSMFGNSGFANANLDTADNVYGFGNGPLTGALLKNSFDIEAMGNNALGQTALTNSFDIYAFGKNAGASLAGTGLSHIFIAGSGGVPTASGDWVAGDAAYRYKFPGTAGATFTGPLKLSGTTNEYTDDGTQLLRNGTPVGSGSSTNPTQNYYSTSNYFTVGKGGKLTITNSISLGDYFIYPLQAGTGITFTTNANPTSGTNITIAASGGGGSALYVNGTSVTNANLKDSGSITYTTTATTNISPGIAAQAFNLLSYSGGTNITIDCSLGNAMEAHYYLTITNTTFFATPTSVPTTAKRFVMHLKNDSTGGYAVAFTNGTFSWSEGVMPIKTTNANYVDVFEFVTSPFTNTDLIGTMVQNVHR